MIFLGKGTMKKTILLTAAFLALFTIQTSAQTWSAPVRLTWTANDSSYPAIAADPSGGVHVVWYDKTFGNIELFYKRSTNAGTTWQAPVRLTWNDGYSNFQKITTDSSNGIYIVWADSTSFGYEIYLKKSTNNGANWSAPNRLTWMDYNSIHPAIATSSGSKIHIVWSQEKSSGYSEIYYKRSIDGGASWLPPTRLTWNSGRSFYPSIAAEATNYVYIVWQDESPGNFEVFYKRSINGGTSWSAPTRLTWNSGDSEDPIVAVDSTGIVHVVWRDTSYGNTEILYKRSSNHGFSWSAPTRLTWSSANSYSPAVAVDSGNGVHVVFRDDTPGNGEIYYKSSPNGGLTWSGLTRLTWNSGGSLFPVVAVDSTDGVHVAWEEMSPGNREIFYKNYK